MRTLIQSGEDVGNERAMYMIRFHSALISGAICPQVAGPFGDDQAIEIVANTITHLAMNLQQTGAQPDQETLDAADSTLHAILTNGRTAMTNSQRKRQRRTIDQIRAAINALGEPSPDPAAIPPTLLTGLGPDAHLTPIE